MRELDRRRVAAEAATLAARARLVALYNEVSGNRAALEDAQQRRAAWLERIDGVAAENYARYGVRAVGDKVDRAIEKQVCARVCVCVCVCKSFDDLDCLLCVLF